MTETAELALKTAIANITNDIANGKSAPLLKTL